MEKLGVEIKPTTYSLELTVLTTVSHLHKDNKKVFWPCVYSKPALFTQTARKFDYAAQLGFVYILKTMTSKSNNIFVFSFPYTATSSKL